MLNWHPMRSIFLALAVTATALPALAQQHVVLFFDAEGVRRTGTTTRFTPGVTRFEPTFQTGGGAGGGLNWFFTDRVSLEAKLAGLGTKTRLRIVGSDFIGTADLGWSQIYPVSAVLQWHLTERGAMRPYIGAGAVHTIMRNINEQIGAGATGIRFKDPTGLVVDGGLEFHIGKKWGLLADARYVPLETKSRAIFPGTSSSVEMSVRPLIVSFGLGFKL